MEGTRSNNPVSIVVKRLVTVEESLRVPPHASLELLRTLLRDTEDAVFVVRNSRGALAEMFGGPAEDGAEVLILLRDEWKCLENSIHVAGCNFAGLLSH